MHLTCSMNSCSFLLTEHSELRISRLSSAVSFDSLVTNVFALVAGTNCGSFYIKMLGIAQHSN